MGNNSRFSLEPDNASRRLERRGFSGWASPSKPWLPGDQSPSLEDAVLTYGNGSEPDPTIAQEQTQDRAPKPLPPAAANPADLKLVAGDPLSLAVSTDFASGGAPLQAVDLDAVDRPHQFGLCSCPACSGAGRTPTGRSSATLTGGTVSAAPVAAVSLQTLADYLTKGYWQEAGTFARKYNLTNAGTGAKNGVITYNLTGWANDTNGISLDRQNLAREVFKTYAATLGITFREVTGTGGDIRFTDNDTGAYAYAASGWYTDSTRTNLIVDYSVVNIEAAWYDGKSNYNTYTPQTIFHEVGHALGLGHAGLYNYTGTPLSYATSAQFANDSWQATMMSYWDQVQNPTTGSSFAWLQTPMSVDWIALNDLYRSQGFSTDKAFRGDTIYGVNTNISAATSQIWNLFSTYAGSTAYTLADGDGFDTLDVSNFNVDQRINLAPTDPGSTVPSLSNIGGKIGNFSITAGTIIEAANGGGGNDSFYGNAAANTFRGNAGNDSFYDSLGSDTYYGDAGSDWLYFSESINLFSYGLAGDALKFSRLSGGDVDLVWNGLENISFNNVAYTYQQLIDSLGVTTLSTVTIQAVNGTLVSGAITNATALTFSGILSQSLTNGQTIAFFRDGVQLGTVTPATPDATSWSFGWTEAAGTSTSTYTARVITTGSSQVGLISNGFQLTVDTIAPQVGVNNLETQDTTPLLSGTINDPAAEVSVRIGSITRTAINNGSGGWTLQWNDVLSPGQSYDVVASATDRAGNIGSDSTSGELIVRPDDFAGDATTPGVVVVGGSSTGTLELNGDHDWFAVDLQAGQTYNFRLDSTAADSYLRLWSSGGSLLASNDDANTSTLNSLITHTAASSGRYYVDAGAFNDIGTGSYTVSAADVTPAPILYFSLANNVTTSSAAVMGGLTARTNDIIAFDGSRFNTWLNGNDNGLSGAVIRDFQIVNNNEVVVAFNAPITLGGIAFDASDLAQIKRTSSGTTLSMLFDGSDVGLTSTATNTAEAIDAITGLADGSWLISTRGAGSVPVGSSSLSFAAEDLLRFNPTSLGTNTAGSWSLYADMSDVGLTTTNSNLNENITAVDVASNGRLYFSSQGNASATGLSAVNEDIFVFQPTSLGSNTAGSFLSPLFFDGSVYGLATNAIQGLDVPL